MCNLYNVTTNQEAIRQFTKAMIDSTGNLQPSLDVYPDQPAPIVRNTAAGREIAMVRWGMPSSRQALFEKAGVRADKQRAKGKEVEFDELLRMEPDKGTTNVRNVDSKHWKRWLGVENRCVVPFNKFAEWDTGSKANAWFASSDDVPLLMFAGIWTEKWTSVRKAKEGEVSVDLYGFLTIDPNAEVKAVHPKAMPVILTNEEEIEQWMTAPWEEARALRRPLPDGSLIRIK